MKQNELLNKLLFEHFNSLEGIKEKAKEYDNALIYYFSDVVLSVDDKLENVDWDEITEAFFFNATCQLHVFRDDKDELIGVTMQEADITDELISERGYNVNNKRFGAGKKIVVREYLKNDEDGQVLVECRRIKEVIRG